jgi:hypothetical protein
MTALARVRPLRSAQHSSAYYSSLIAQGQPKRTSSAKTFAKKTFEAFLGVLWRILFANFAVKGFSVNGVRCSFVTLSLV